MEKKPDTNKLVDHLFRHEAGKMIAVLTRFFGLEHLELAEDVVQEAFLRAVQVWAYQEIPKNPAGWLMQVAKNKAIDVLRKNNLEQRHFRNLTVTDQSYLQAGLDDFFLENEIADSQLQMIFACCHPALEHDDQLALTLNTVSGFGSAEIARALLSKESAIQKRLYRAKQFIRENQIQLEIPLGKALVERLDRVYTVIYLLFNEGYNSVKANELIRKDLCAEAMRLCKILSEHPCGNRPMTFALLSLMCFHASRFDSRVNENNEIILMQEQDRSKWDKELIALGYHFLSEAAEGDALSIYHIESAIAAEHCLSHSFKETNWHRILQLYDLLLEQKRSDLVLLNRSVVLAQTGSLQEAIREILQIKEIDKLLETQYMFSAVLGDLYMQSGDFDKARDFLGKAYTLTHSQAEKKLIASKLAKTNSTN